jgi:hypothetical protein
MLCSFGWGLSATHPHATGSSTLQALRFPALAEVCRSVCRLGQKRRVLMGLSDIQGWGAFLQQAAQKDEFVVSGARC